MSERIPILQLGDLLLITIQVDLHDQLALSLQQDISEEVVRRRPSGIVIDVSALDVVDSFIGHVFVNIAAAAQMLGTNVVVVGIRPAVAITMVELGLPLDDIHTSLDVDRAVMLLRQMADPSTETSEWEFAGDEFAGDGGSQHV